MPSTYMGADIIWVRIERRPGSHHTSIASDTIELSSNMAHLYDANRDRRTAEMDICGANFRHVLHTLSIVHDMAPRYHWRSLNCWYFIDLVINILHIEFRGSWLKRMKRTWTKRVIHFAHDEAALLEMAVGTFRDECKGVIETVHGGIFDPRRVVVRSNPSARLCHVLIHFVFV